MLTFGSLFSGVGAFDLAFERAGWRCLWQCEIDPQCRRVLKSHWPDATVYEDVRSIRGATVTVPDCIVGGFPCQDLSVAGRRRGLAGERSGLWWEFRRILAEVAPLWVLIENVPGLLSSFSPVEPPPEPVEGREWEVEESSDLGTILDSLGELGYWWAYRVLDAQYDGLAQRRERVFVVGRLGDSPGLGGKKPRKADRGLRGLPAKALFEAESVFRDSPPRRGSGQDAAALAAFGAGGDSVVCGGSDNLVVGALQAHSKRHGHAATTQQAAESNQIVVVEAFQANGAGSFRAGSVSLAASDDNGSNQVVVTQRTYRELAEGHATYQEADDIGCSLRTSSGGGATKANLVVSVTGGLAHALTSRHDSSEDGTGRGAPIVAFHVTQDPISGQIAPALSKGNEQGCGSVGVAYAFQERGRKEGRTLESQEELAYCLLNPGNGGRSHESNVLHGMTVRRLTPVEYLRLQGLPDDWLSVPGKRLSDSACYRMVGNSGSVPTVEWIARRIRAVEESHGRTTHRR